MHPVDAESLEALYARAIMLGKELISLLEGPSPTAVIDRVMALLAERGQIAELTGALAATGVSSANALPLLRRIVEQQPAIEAGLLSALEVLHNQQMAAQIQRQKVQGAQSLLTTGPRSRLLNEYR